MKNNNGICSLSHLVYRQNTSLLRIKSKVENQHLVFTVCIQGYSSDTDFP